MTLRAFLDRSADSHPDASAMEFCRGGVRCLRSFRELRERARLVAELAGSLGVKPRAEPVAICLENRPEWVEVYLGLACSGIPVVPIDPKLRPGERGHILRDSGAAVLFAGRAENLNRGDLSALRHVVRLDPGTGVPAAAGSGEVDFETALAAVAPRAATTDACYARRMPAPDDLASLLYTSGTTGAPKGAMLTHANFCHDVEGVLQAVTGFTSNDRFLVVLPLFHAFSFTANLLVPLRVAAAMQFVDSLRNLGEELRRLGPTVLIAVPLLAEKLYGRIAESLRRKPLARLLLALRLRGPVARAVRRSLGGRLRLVVCGGAPCPVAVLQGLRSLGVPAFEGYGLTEAAPVVTLSKADDARPGTIGYALPNIEVRIAAPDRNGVGELQVRGPIVMRGYLGNPAATAEAFDGEWLRTGDLASRDADGYFTIRGRKKALIVNREGKNIYPEEVEQCLSRHPYLRDVVVIGYREGGEVGEKVGTIVVPDLEAIAARRGGDAPSWDEAEILARQAVRERCAELADYKHPRKVEVRREPLERTPTQKVKRHLYEGQLDAPAGHLPGTAAVTGSDSSRRGAVAAHASRLTRDAERPPSSDAS